MSSVYPAEVREAVRVLYRRDVSPSRTKELLAEGKAGLDKPYDPSLSSIEKWRAEFRREGEIKGFAVGPGQETEVEDAIYQDALAAGRMAARRLKEQELKGKVDAALPGRVKVYLTMIDGRRQRVQRKEEGKTPDRNAAKEASPSTLLRRAHEDRLREQANEPGNQSEAIQREEKTEGERKQRDKETVHNPPTDHE